MKHDVGLAALIVNFNTGSYAVACVRSLIHEWEREGRSREKLRIVCVDNASPMDQSAYCAELESFGVEVVIAEENLGYARGMNLAYSHAYAGDWGAEGDVVAILNPDLHFMPDSVGVLLDYIIDHPECGCIDPTTCIDELGVFNLPRNLLPTPAEHWRVTLAQLAPFLCQRYSRYRLPLALEWWRTKGPLKSDMLSGCCVFLRREVVEQMGHVMDPRYPLYFEDTDLFRTLSELGYEVVHHNGARILHHWSRAALVSGEFGEPQRFLEISQAAYYKKFYGPLGRFLVASIDWVARRWPRRWFGRPMMSMESLDVVEEPIELAWEHSCPFLIEIAVNPTFIICAGVFGEGDRWVCPEEAWNWLFQLDYYMRAIDLNTMQEVGAWSFSKGRPGREEAITQDELDRLGERLLSEVHR